MTVEARVEAKAKAELAKAPTATQPEFARESIQKQLETAYRGSRGKPLFRYFGAEPGSRLRFSCFEQRMLGLRGSYNNARRCCDDRIPSKRSAFSANSLSVSNRRFPERAKLDLAIVEE